MAEAATAIINKPAWVDLASKDPAASREFYTKVFGWAIEVNPDPQYGGYGIAKVGGHDAAGIGGAQCPRTSQARGRCTSARTMSTPSASVIATRRDGRDGAVRRWRPGQDGRLPGPDRGIHLGLAGTRRWAVSRRRDRMPSAGPTSTLAASRRRCRSTRRSSAGSQSRPARRNARIPSSRSTARASSARPEIDPMVPPEVPGYWMVYFTVAGRRRRDPDRHGCRGARELVPPVDFPGGRMSIIRDPQGAAFGLMSLSPS